MTSAQRSIANIFEGKILKMRIQGTWVYHSGFNGSTIVHGNMIKITSQSAFSLQSLLEIIGKHVSQLRNRFSCTVVIIVNGFEAVHDDE